MDDENESYGFGKCFAVLRKTSCDGWPRLGNSVYLTEMGNERIQ